MHLHDTHLLQAHGQGFSSGILQCFRTHFRMDLMSGKRRGVSFPLSGKPKVHRHLLHTRSLCLYHWRPSKQEREGDRSRLGKEERNYSPKHHWNAPLFIFVCKSKAKEKWLHHKTMHKPFISHSDARWWCLNDLIWCFIIKLPTPTCSFFFKLYIQKPATSNLLWHVYRTLVFDSNQQKISIQCLDQLCVLFVLAQS